MTSTLAASFAAIASGNEDLSEVLLLVAFILATVATVLRVIARSVDGALVAAAIAVLALAFLVL